MGGLSQYARRVDKDSKVLRDRARQQGVLCLPVNGVFDDLWYVGSRLVMVDYKTPKTGRKTAKQAELDADGWPIRYVATPADVDTIIRDARRHV